MLHVLDDSWVSRVVDDETGTAVSARVDELVWISSEPGPEDAGGDNDSGECEPGQLCDPRVDIGPTDSLDPEGGVGRFRKLTVDSTSVKANSEWPTDSKILTGLLNRGHRLGQKMHLFGWRIFARDGYRVGWRRWTRWSFRYAFRPAKRTPRAS